MPENYTQEYISETTVRPEFTQAQARALIDHLELTDTWPTCLTTQAQLALNELEDALTSAESMNK